MNIILKAALDARNTPLTAAIVLGHPISQTLERKSVARMYDLAYRGALESRVDGAFIHLVGSAALALDEVSA
jgi:hypothetical protein